MRKLLALTLFAGCATTDVDTGRISVPEKNDLGVVEIQLERLENNGKVFELHGIDAAGADVALVRVRKGIVEGLPKVEDPTAIGTEIELSVGDARERKITWETDRFEVGTYHDAIQQFLTLPTVASTLEREENLTAILPQGTDASSSGESAYYGTQQCAGDQLLSTPTAQHCCADYYDASHPTGTIFIRPSDSSIVRRSKSYNYGTCKSSTGGSCSGADCYYGPFGYTRPLIDASTGYGWSIVVQYSWNGQSLIPWCQMSSGTYNPPQFTYGNSTGSQSNGVGCPGGATGAGEWDY